MFFRVFNQFINISNCNRIEVCTIGSHNNEIIHGVKFFHDRGEPTTIECPNMTEKEIIESIINAFNTLKSNDLMSTILYINNKVMNY